jgi:RHS repeat-associated protein
MSPEVELSNLYDYERIQADETAHYYYHPDHLGSASWITDSSGKAIQHLQYLPFGETRVDQRATGSNWSTRYSFSAKEKDEESGYSYFSSRYYDSEISIFLTIDPKSASHPMTNNYMYCLGNPLRLVDPNGEDEYEFDDFGYIRKVAESDYDSFHKIDENGNRIEGSSLTFDKKIIEGDITEHPSSVLPDAQMFSVNDADAAGTLFEHLASNTSVEWGMANTESEDCTTFIGTNHDKTMNSIRSIVKNLGYDIERMVHNHPNDINSVSDKDNAGTIGNFKTQFFNWTKSHGYTRYDSSTPYVDTKGDSHIPLPHEIIVRPK